MFTLIIGAGHEVMVLEARDRIGGRVHTNRSFADVPVEFIHGDTAPT